MCISVVGCCSGTSNFKLSFSLNILAQADFCSLSASSFLEFCLSYFGLRAGIHDRSLIKRNQLNDCQQQCSFKHKISLSE